jgi:hypothetical protein
VRIVGGILERVNSVEIVHEKTSTKSGLSVLFRCYFLGHRDKGN